MQSFLVSHAIYAIVLFGVLEAMCIPISSELTFLLGGAIASGGVAGTSQHHARSWGSTSTRHSNSSGRKVKVRPPPPG